MMHKTRQIDRETIMMRQQDFGQTLRGFRACSWLLFVSLCASTKPAAANETLAGFDNYVKAAMKQWEVPGVAVSVVKDGEIVLARGYGIGKLGEREPITSETLFPIASCTKSFTAMAIGLLCDAKKLEWDDAVQKHLSEFELCDPFLTREVSVRDLLAHRTGLELGNKLWSKNEFSPDEIMNRLRFLKPRHSFRSRFTYSNLMYLAAGKVVEKSSAKSWSEFVKSRILCPLEMRATTTQFPGEANIAWPHADLDGKVVAIRMERGFNESVAPAGTMWSTSRDMANWIQMNLARGKFGNRQVILADTLDEMHSSQVVIRGLSKGRVYPKQNFRSYGIGWFVDDIRGRKLVWHSGSRNGFVAWVAMLPEEQLGFVILSNSHRSGINFALHHRILDAYLGEPSKDWSTIVKNDYTNGWHKLLSEAKAAYEKRRQPDTKPDLQLDRYAGTYHNDLYGNAIIRSKDKALELRFGPRHITKLEHWQDNTFRAVFPNPMLESWHVTFKVLERDNVDSLRAVAAPWVPWYEDSTDLGVFHRTNADNE
jgi:CubicO group peptidase (beta-lactamase class C family)